MPRDKRPAISPALLFLGPSGRYRQRLFASGPLHCGAREYPRTFVRRCPGKRTTCEGHTVSRASSFVSRPGSSSIRLIFTSRMCTGSERACLLVHFRTINSVILKWILGRRRACCDLKGTHDCWDRVNPRMLKNPPRIIQVLEIPKFIFHNISLNSI